MSLYHFGDKEFELAKQLVEEGVTIDTTLEETQLEEEGIGSAIKDAGTIAGNVRNVGLSLSGIKKLWSDDKNYKALMTAMPEAYNGFSEATKLSIVKDLFKNEKIKGMKKFIGSSGEAFVPGGSDKDKAIAFFDMLFGAYLNPQFAKNGMAEFKKQMGTKFAEIAQATKTESDTEANLGKTDLKDLDDKLTEYLDKIEPKILKAATTLYKDGRSDTEVLDKIFAQLAKSIDKAPFNEDGSVTLLARAKEIVTEDPAVADVGSLLIDMIGDEMDLIIAEARQNAKATPEAK